jgi:serine/threonine protein kinase/tetratricopeptide (TPR) repeat protein
LDGGLEEVTLLTGTKLGRYEIRSKIGEGGMGEVYLAQDTELDRKVALKFLPEDLASDAERMRRFVQEAKAASGLNHPNIITIHEIGEADGAHFIATEFIDGTTLRERLNRGPLPLDQVLSIATQTTEALSAAHAAGIVHRDVKPENIMLRRDGYVKVLDFGIAKLTEQITREIDTEGATAKQFNTGPGSIMGTTAYMSPEQVRSQVLDARTDIWSLGVVLFELVAHQKLFPGESPGDVIAEILKTEPPSLAEVRRDCPAELERIVTTALQKKREKRYQLVKELGRDLKRLKRRLEFEAELERTGGPSERTGELRESTNAAAATPPEAATQTLGANANQTSSSAEYIVSQIKTHKRGFAVALLLLVLAAGALSYFLYFKPVHAPALTDKDTILLADFDNETGDTVFDGTLNQGLAVTLAQSPFLDIFSDARVRETLRFMNRSSDERVTKGIAREICERQGLKAFLAGSISNFGTHYVITLEAANAQTGDTIALQQAEAENKEQVLSALGNAATKLREKLGESLASIQKYNAPLYQATTSSLEALKIFSLGVEQQLKGKYLEAIPFFKRATETDPDFALAYARLASVYFNTGQFGLAAGASQKAYDLRDRVSERERLFISMSYYSNVTREVEKYIETLGLWERTYTRDLVPHNNLALQYNDIGQYEQAAEEAREAIRLNPSAAAPQSNLARALLGLNRFDEAKEGIGRALARQVESIFMHRILYWIAFIQGDEAGMKQQIEWTNGKPEEYTAQNWQVETAAFSGQLRKAKEFSSRAAELAQRRDLKEVVAQIVAGDAVREALFGDCKQVKERTAKALAITESQPARVSAANALAVCGEFNHMQTIVDELVKRYPKDTLLNNVFLPLIQARAEMNRGNGAQAIRLLEITRSYEGAALFQVAYLRGQAYLSQQKGAEAATEFQKILDHRGSQPVSYFYPLAHLELARGAALAGDTAKARQAYENFFALWKDADADLLVLREAKKEYEKLK